MKNKFLKFFSLSLFILFSGCGSSTLPNEEQNLDQVKKSTDEGADKKQKQEQEEVVSNEKPTIVFNCSNKVVYYQNDVYRRLCYKAKDKEDGDITSKVKVVDNVDITKPGTYKNRYSVTDSFGDEFVIYKTITVLPQDDIRAEVIKTTTFDNTHKFNLWNYMINKNDDSVEIQKFNHKIKTTTQINRLKLISPNELMISLPYTLRVLKYIKGSNGTIDINFYKNSEKLKSVVLKDEVIKGESMILNSQNENTCSINEHYDTIKLAQSTYNDVIKISCTNEEEAYFAKDKGLVLENVISGVKPEYVKESFFELGELGLKDITYKVKISLSEVNLKSVQKTNSELLFSDPYNLSGDGITIGVIDGGMVRDTHVEFDGRVVNITDRNISSHATHVAGTIAAKGINPDAHGFANKVKIEATSYDNYYFGWAMDMFHKKGIDITNHSYGVSEIDSLGVYTDIAYHGDMMVTKYPTIIALKASGNDRNSQGFDKYGIIKSFGNAKNIITVGSIDYDNKLSSFSSTGPVKNGRIKPDIVTKGSKITSLGIDSDNEYVQKQGTSMATPAATGVVILMQEEYKKINNKKMREDIAKGILVNTAKDLGRIGPDYEYGFGLIDGLEAVKTIDSMDTDETLVKDENISKTKTHIYTLELSEDFEFKATLSWIDPTDNVLDAELFSDLDLSIQDDNNNVIYPFTLNPDSPEELAKQDKYNNVDNVEQIQTYLSAGTYKVIVKVNKMKNRQSQPYALISNISLGNKEVLSADLDINEFETTLYKVQNR
jgi:hypothetical protein